MARLLDPLAYARMRREAGLGWGKAGESAGTDILTGISGLTEKGFMPEDIARRQAEENRKTQAEFMQAKKRSMELAPLLKLLSIASYSPNAEAVLPHAGKLLGGEGFGKPDTGAVFNEIAGGIGKQRQIGEARKRVGEATKEYPDPLLSLIQGVEDPLEQQRKLFEKPQKSEHEAWQEALGDVERDQMLGIEATADESEKARKLAQKYSLSPYAQAEVASQQKRDAIEARKREREEEKSRADIEAKEKDLQVKKEGVKVRRSAVDLGWSKQKTADEQARQLAGALQPDVPDFGAADPGAEPPAGKLPSSVTPAGASVIERATRPERPSLAETAVLRQRALQTMAVDDVIAAAEKDPSATPEKIAALREKLTASYSDKPSYRILVQTVLGMQ